MNDTEVLEEEQESLLEKCSRVVRKKVKVEGAPSGAWVDPLYAEQPTITWDKLTPLKRGYFAETFGLCNEGLAPKRLRYGVHLLESDVEALFGVKVNSNGYAYSSLEDTSFVEKVERIWMTTHQRTSVPNTRLINVAEAKGLAYELLPNKKTNWCLHAEWTCRDQLRRYNLEREDRKKYTPGSGSEKDGAVDVIEIGIGGVEPQPSRSAQVTDSGLGLEVKSVRHSMSIGEWQEYLSLLNKEIPTLEGIVKLRCEEKDAAKMELVKLSTQYEYGRSLLGTAELRLQTLEDECCKGDGDLVVLNARVPENDGEIGAAVLHVADLRRQVQAQRGVIDQMRMMFGSGETGFEEAAKKTKNAEEAYGNAVAKQELWRHHKIVLTTQLKGMKAGYQRPACFPAPLPFLYLDCHKDLGETVILEIAPCPFCTKGFDPMWDCKFSSCQHAYHSWCAYSHFSNCTKCLFKDCGKEMHGDWWVMAGIKKPDVDNGKGTTLEFWNNESDDLGNDLRDPMRTSRSFSTVGVHSARSNTVSPSIGQSFQWLGAGMMETKEGCRLEFQGRLQEVGKDPEPQCMEEGGSSPKRKKFFHKTLNVDMVVQEEEPQHVEGKSKPPPACKGPIGEDTGKEGEGGSTCPEKRRRGTTKKGVLQIVEEDAPSQKVGDDYELESEGDVACDKSVSLDGESGKERDDNGESDAEEAPNSARGKPGKQSSKARNKKGKKPVKERISLSTKTRAALNKPSRI